jgi:hypothetical protein
MLYDQAMLAMAFTEAYQATGKKEYKKIVENIFEYILRDMTSPEGGFYSAEDADSEGEEGKFYLWSEEEIIQELGEESETILRIFNTTKEGNYGDELHGKSTGKNILHMKNSLPRYAKDLNFTSEELESQVENARKILLELRSKRIRPSKDDKILTDWNGLMIAAMAKAGWALNNDAYIDSTKRAADFIIKNMEDEKTGLLHRFRKDEASIAGFIDDHAFFVWGLLELYQSTFDVKYLNYAIKLNRYMLEHFWDNKNGGLYSTSHEAENLFVRQKAGYDGAIPSGNSVAMLNLLKLSRITGNSEFEKKAWEIAQVFSRSISSSPSSHTHFLAALDFAFGPSYEVIVCGDLKSDDTKEMLDALRDSYVPNMVLIHRPKDEEQGILSISPFTKDMILKNGKATAYVCQNFSCNFPTNDIEKMIELLNVKKR